MYTYHIKYKINDILYILIDGFAQPVTVDEISISNEGIYYRAHYCRNGARMHTKLTEDLMYLTASECEKAYILEKYSHLFKDTKTLK